MSAPRKILRDGRPWREFAYDHAARRIVVRGGDPRLHRFETVVRGHGVDLGGRKDVKIEGITMTNILNAAEAPGAPTQ